MSSADSHGSFSTFPIGAETLSSLKMVQKATSFVSKVRKTEDEQNILPNFTLYISTSGRT